VQVALVGIGLIGGSIGLAARERLGARVSGFDPSPRARAAALERGAVDAAFASVEQALAGAAFAFVAAPVAALPDAVGAALAAAAPDCVVSDVGSTKRPIVGAIDDERFVGGHPLSGAETAGVEHARADLFDDATWYLTPTAATAGSVYERLHRLLTRLGALPTAIDAETHDAVMASVSHLPHVLANVLVGQAAHLLSAEGDRLPATGPSFRDLTRVAGASTALWRDIYLANGDALIGAIDDAVARLTGFRALLGARDGAGIAAWNDAAREDRRRLLEVGLAGGDVHELRVQVPNRPGVVAEIALALGRASVDIADMALYPTAAGTAGMIALWIRGDDTAAQAERLVAELGLEATRVGRVASTGANDAPEVT